MGDRMNEREALIVNPLGLHARPAAQIVRLATSFASDIRLEKDGMEVNGKSIMGVMMLSAECGSTIRIKADGEDSERAVDALSKLVAEGFNE
jgi:phosphocarrier protein